MLLAGLTRYSSRSKQIEFIARHKNNIFRWLMGCSELMRIEGEV